MYIGILYYVQHYLVDRRMMWCAVQGARPQNNNWNVRRR